MEDRAIVELYWARDPEAIVQSGKKYGRYCFSIANRILNSPRDAEECVNDTYLQAWKAMPPHRPKVLSVFLGKLTRNLSFNRRRREQADKRGGGQLELVLEELEECVDGGGNTEEALLRQELLEAVNAFLAGLPQKKRDMFLLRYWYVWSVGDIARRHAMTEGAVSMTLSRLRRQLKEELCKGGYLP